MEISVPSEESHVQPKPLLSSEWIYFAFSPFRFACSRMPLFVHPKMFFFSLANIFVHCVNNQRYSNLTLIPVLELWLPCLGEVIKIDRGTDILVNLPSGALVIRSSTCVKYNFLTQEEVGRGRHWYGKVAGWQLTVLSLPRWHIQAIEGDNFGNSEFPSIWKVGWKGWMSKSKSFQNICRKTWSGLWKVPLVRRLLYGSQRLWFLFLS